MGHNKWNEHIKTMKEESESINYNPNQGDKLMNNAMNC